MISLTSLFIAFIVFLLLGQLLSVDVVPNIVHQIYDYPSPNFFMFLSLLCTQHFIKPDRHVLWINDEGRFRMQHWNSWLDKATQQLSSSATISSSTTASSLSWEARFADLLKRGKIEPKFITFPAHPPGNESTFVSNKAHRSDFVRLSALSKEGGIYLDTDVFPMSTSIHSLRAFNFTIAYDNVINPDKLAPKRMNNGVLMSSPGSGFLKLWTAAYASFDPNSWDMSSSIVPFNLAMEYPDLVHVEMNRLSPVSFAFQTSEAAAALTCGILMPTKGAIIHPRWDSTSKSYSFQGALPDKQLYRRLQDKFVLHLTMTGVRGVNMMRKTLHSPSELDLLPSLLGSIFRQAYYGTDSFDYKAVSSSVELQNKAWKSCRDAMGMHSSPDDLIAFGGAGSGADFKGTSVQRQQYMSSSQIE